jgi:hypothetical protein
VAAALQAALGERLQLHVTAPMHPSLPAISSFVARAQRRLSRYLDLAITVVADGLDIAPADDDGFPIRLRISVGRFTVFMGGWSRTFDREEDALDCLEFGLGETCRLLVEYRGATEVAWTVQSREYGMWQPHHRVSRVFVPFWRASRVEYRQNRRMTA